MRPLDFIALSNCHSVIGELVKGVSRGFATALLTGTFLLSVAVLAGSVDARLQAAKSICGFRIHQFQDVAWLSNLAVIAFGLTGWVVAKKCNFHLRVCGMCFVASSLISLTSLIVVGNN